MTMELYGHPFSSYTWKALIALRVAGIEFDFRMVDDEHPENQAVVRGAGPLGKFPVLRDGENLIFESTSIIEYIANGRAEPETLIPSDADAALGMRMLDRVFDNYVMGPAQDVVIEHLRAPGNPDMARVQEACGKLERCYAWLEGWLEFYPVMDQITLVECSAAPALFYADWVHPIDESFPRLKQWRAHLLQLPPVACCVDDARPWRQYFPPGAPDHD